MTISRTSSIRKIWQELEAECLAGRLEETGSEQMSDVSNYKFESPSLFDRQGDGDGGCLMDSIGVENVQGQCPQSQKESRNADENEKGSSLKPCTPIGEVEGQRVRQVLREWRGNGLKWHESHPAHTNNREQWLGENERRRVRIVREWIEMSTQQTENCCGSKEEKIPEIGTQIEKVRDGLAVDHCDGGARRAIRKLCGRQALLDLIARSERERKKELQGLLEQRPVSNFAHRNRIQSLLKGRFLKKRGFIHDKRPTSAAASELGLLKERQTVSGLREGFLSRLDSFGDGPRSGIESCTSSDRVTLCYENEQTQENILQKVPDEISDDLESTDKETGIGESNISDMESDIIRDLNLLEVTVPVEQRQEQILEAEDKAETQSTVEYLVRSDIDGQDACKKWKGSDRNVCPQDALAIGGRSQSFLSEMNSEMHEHYDESSEVHGGSDHIDYLGTNTVEECHYSVTENDETVWNQSASIAFSEITDLNSHESSHGWYQETAESDSLEPHEEWHQNIFEASRKNWLDPSRLEVGQMSNTLYTSADDTGYTLELRELMSRRRVSSLLQSGFRERLNQLILSYLERQGHNPDEWALDGVSVSPAFREQHSVYENASDSEAAERTEFGLPSSPVTLQTQWNQDFHDAAWPNMNQCPGMGWEAISDLRIEMVRLQQEMNNMHKMLEACMRMQLELKRSVKEELSIALNRVTASAELCKECLRNDEAKRDGAKKGISCISIDSDSDLPFHRCGHMYKCSEGADRLVLANGKCPMCQAP